MRDSPYWLIAALLHVVLLLVLATIVVFEKEERAIAEPITIRRAEKPPLPELIRPALRDVPEFETENPPAEQLTERVAKRPTAPRLSPRIERADPIGIGPGSPESGAFVVGSELRSPGAGGGSDAVRLALEWLVRHQHADGHWSCREYSTACDHSAGRCAFRSVEVLGRSDDGGDAAYDVGVTALALLAFTGFGTTHLDGERPEFRSSVDRAARWLVRQQIRSDDPTLDGRIGPPGDGSTETIYNHAIATLALADLLAVSDDRIRLRRPVEAALEWCLRAQNPGAGWRYGYRDGESDTSVTGWMVFALKSARACAHLRHIKIEETRLDDAFAGALAWIENTTGSRSAITGYRAPGDPGSHLQGVYGDGDYPYSKRLSCMTAVAVLSRIFAGEGRRAGHQGPAIRHLTEHPPEWTVPGGRTPSTINFYSWYYATYALYQVGGRPWRSWNEALVPTMLENQRTDGCSRGSWDPIGEWGVAGGRVYSTAMGALILEVTYRYAREKGGSP